jgi:hypothetical protein
MGWRPRRAAGISLQRHALNKPRVAAAVLVYRICIGIDPKGDSTFGSA